MCIYVYVYIIRILSIELCEYGGKKKRAQTRLLIWWSSQEVAKLYTDRAGVEVEIL